MSPRAPACSSLPCRLWFERGLVSLPRTDSLDVLLSGGGGVMGKESAEGSVSGGGGESIWSAADCATFGLGSVAVSLWQGSALSEPGALVGMTDIGARHD